MAMPIPPLSFTGGPSGAYADGTFADYGTNFLEGDDWAYNADFNVGGSGAFASASGSSSVWKWVAVAVGAVLIARILKG